MAFKPNYRFGRSERDRLKQTKKEDKLRRKQERKAQRDEPEAGERAPRTDDPIDRGK